MGYYQGLWGVLNSPFINKLKPYLGMVSLQFGYSGMYIIVLVSLKGGFSHWILVVYRHAIATLVFVPFTYFLERYLLSTKTVLSFYSMGRMESIWGKDCLEFKPGRWIYDVGRIKTEPSFKFTAFNAGPRSCLGKEMSFIQLKIVAASIISRFHFTVVERHLICPSDSVILHMKHGLKVKVSKYD